MSASREKKNRQAFAASGAIDPKAARAAEEKAQQRKSRLLYGSIAVIFVIVAVLVLLWNSNVFQRNATALTVGDKTYSAAEVQYSYYAAYSDVRSSSYFSYMGVDTSRSIGSQTMSDTAKMLCGVTSEDSLTWGEYLMDKAKSNLQTSQSMLAAAEKEGFTWTDAMQSEYDEIIASVKSSAKSAGYTYKNYVKAMYGTLVTTGVFESMAKDSVLLTAFQNDYLSKLNYTDEEIEKYYQDNKSTFDVADYDYIRFSGTTSATKDADGNTVDATQEEMDAAIAAAKDGANAALARFRNGESLEDIAKDYDIATYYPVTDGSNTSDTVATWVFEKATAAGESTVLDDGTNYYVAVFHKLGRQEYNTVDVRHILIKVDTSSLDTKSETYEQDLADLKAQKKAEAEKILQEWKDGAATEASFGELADKYSADSPAGGLYEKVYKGQMVTNFNDWCFDASRKTGDTDIVETNFGYHIMYFVGEDLPYWRVRVTNTMTNNDLNAWVASLQQEYTVTEGSGMKYVG